MNNVASNAMIEISNLKKAFGDHVVLKDISIQIERGSVVAMIGPSGSGKSTLLRCLNLLTVPDRGSVRIGQRHFEFDGKKSRLPEAGNHDGDRRISGGTHDQFRLAHRRSLA